MVSTNLTYDLGDFTQQELTVWELDAPQRLKPDTRQPPRRKQIAWTTVVSDGSYETSPSFPCISGTHLAFELTCASRKHECHVNFWQDGMKLSPLVGKSPKKSALYYAEIAQRRVLHVANMIVQLILMELRRGPPWTLY